VELFSTGSANSTVFEVSRRRQFCADAFCPAHIYSGFSGDAYSEASARKNTALLDGEDRRTIGRSNQVVAIVSNDPDLFRELIAGLWETDAALRMRAAGAAEKVTRNHPELLQPYKKERLGLMSEVEQ
jgi:hypothetical protein